MCWRHLFIIGSRGPFINDVTQIWTFSDPPLPSDLNITLDLCGDKLVGWITISLLPIQTLDSVKQFSEQIYFLYIVPYTVCSLDLQTLISYKLTTCQLLYLTSTYNTREYYLQYYISTMKPLQWNTSLRNKKVTWSDNVQILLFAILNVFSFPSFFPFLKIMTQNNSIN